MARASQGTKTLPCELLEWDSEHFGFPIGRVAGDALAPGRARAIDEWCLDQGIRCLYLCLDAGDVDSAQVALDHDFHVVDLRVIARRSLEDVAQLPEGPKAVAVREAAEEDWDYLVGLATRSHYASRFYLDRGFPRDRCDALYQAWMERGLRDPSRTVHVPVVEGEPAGYHVLAPLDDAREGHGELVAIDERHRGRGVGVALEVSSMRLLAGRGALTQRTTSSARNLAASRLHERLGFLTEKIEVWHHKWYR